MKAHKLTWMGRTSAPETKNNLQQKTFAGRAVATNVFKTFSIWELVESSFCLWEGGGGGGGGVKMQRNLKYQSKASCILSFRGDILFRNAFLLLQPKFFFVFSSVCCHILRAAVLNNWTWQENQLLFTFLQQPRSLDLFYLTLISA